MNNNRIITFWILLILSACSSTRKNTHSKEKVTTAIIEKVYPLAIRGELIEVFKILDTIDDNQLTKKQKTTKRKFHNRFISGKESYKFRTKDSEIIQLVRHYHTYWKSVMLNKQPSRIADSLFKETMVIYLEQNINNFKFQSEISDRKVREYSNEFLGKRGYFSNAFGKTAHLHDLFLWKKEEVKVYPIQLLEDSVSVTVHFMKDFISRGWTYYSTLGKNSASGWATKKALYAVDEVYDRKSEKFKISFLAHEGQHFSDFQNFPMLKSADLEYRAKLTELVMSNKTTHKLIQKFISGSKKGDSSPHGLANYCLVRDLSQLIFEEENITNKEKWLNTSPEAIRNKSEFLFKKHTKRLKELGSKTVTELIAS